MNANYHCCGCGGGIATAGTPGRGSNDVYQSRSINWSEIDLTQYNGVLDTIECFFGMEGDCEEGGKRLTSASIASLAFVYFAIV